MDTETEITVGVPVEQVQIALFAIAAICVGLAVYLVVRSSR